ncbi:MAG TPA: hypothetical protein VFN87_01495 [Solirubrobacteraceae bacterium]|nr:hypothetical protein [Solirubrobacteraceae bacterium]
MTRLTTLPMRTLAALPAVLVIAAGCLLSAPTPSGAATRGRIAPASARATGPGHQAPHAPLLSQLPGALVDRHAPLSVALPAPVSPASLRAATVAVSAVDRAAGSAGMATQVLVGPSAAQLAAAPGPVISIVPRPGRPWLALDVLPGGHLRLTISGAGDGLAAAARLLGTHAIQAFSTRAAGVPTALAKPVTVAPVPATAAVTPATATGTGTLRVSTGFTLPVDRQLVGNNTLKLVTAYSSPSGGHLSASLGGGLVGGWDARPTGQLRTVSTFDLTSDPALSGNTIPGNWAHVGRDQVTVTASPARHGASGTLQILAGSRLRLNTVPRPPELELGLWPFPLYDAAAWSHTTVVLGAAPQPPLIAAVISALANTARVTGVLADPRIALGAPAADELSGNLILAGAAARQAADGQMPGLHGVRATQPRLPGVLEEVKLPHGHTGLLAYGTAALRALGAGYQVGALRGRAVLVDRFGRAQTLAGGESPPVFAQPRWPWLAPAGVLAVLALGWVAVRIWRARQRLVSLAPLETPGGGGA